tara:strand:+ start:181 stop:342 length:162 start_codon:yes stop_codon:yes gene_type:complete
MNYEIFTEICSNNAIDNLIALENENVRNYLSNSKGKDIETAKKELTEIINNNF